MNPVWIILWISSQPVLVNDVKIGVELLDHSTIRTTEQAAWDWKRELRDHGVGLNFQVFECYKREEKN